MKHTTPLIIIIAILLIATRACSNTASSPAPASVDTQATVDAAVAATAQAAANIQATVNVSVAQTATAMPPQPTPGPTVEYVTMTEEELAALIDQSVNAAVAATTQASTATTQATSDDNLTQEEVNTVYVYAQAADAAIAYADEVINAYYDLYGDLATETLDMLSAVEQDLNAMAENTAALNASLQEINDTLAQGITLAEDTINQLEATAQQAQANVADAQVQAQNWANNLHAEIEDRANAALAIKPNELPTDKISALQSAFDYVDLVKNSLADNKLSKDELNGIAQLGANASAGLQSFGGAQLQGMSGKINEITGQLARGQMPQARAGLGSFETSLGTRPSMPSRPGSGLKP
jgi:hypothetical protein